MSLFIRLVLLIILSWSHGFAYASSGQGAKFDWMNASITNMGSFLPSCLYAPQFTSIHTNDYLLNLDKSGEWVQTNLRLDEGKLLQMEWNTRFIQPRPAKYKVIYRIDPRFEKPQIFIQKYDYDQAKYLSDFHQFKNGQLLKYQDTPEMTFSNHIDDITEYFNFTGRNKIQVKKDDVINISLDHTGQYFGGSSEMNTNLGTGDDLLIMYTHSSMKDNQIIYSDADKWCQNAILVGNPYSAINCLADGTYWDTNDNWKTFTGKIDQSVFTPDTNQFVGCADSANGKANDPVCYYDKGRGVQIKLAGTTIKPITEKFAHSDVNNGDFFYYKSDTDGDLDFVTEWNIAGMYNSPHQLLKDWQDKISYDFFTNFMLGQKPSLTMNFLHFGRYLLNVEVGNSEEVIPKEEIDAIQVEYIIVENGGDTPSENISGTIVDSDFRTNANMSGYLWLRVIRPTDNMTGSVQVKTMNYTGSTWFSDVVYTGLVQPLRSRFNELSMTLYSKFVSNATLQNIARTMLALYIIIYGLMFLAGATQIKAIDIVQRVLKIALILVLFSETSWTFFNNNLFKFFVEGTDYLFTAVVGVTSNTGNVFGFIDPIFDKYTNDRVWALLFIQLLQIHNGLTFFAIMVIYSILIYFIAIIEIVVSYCLAFLGIAVMISLAPFFIILILFERTKSIFDNWISTLFGYMIKPTLLLIFFLLIDQIMTDHLAKTVVTACWDILIPIKIGLDLNHMGIPLSFSFTLPFFPGIPFYVPEISPINTIEDFFATSGTFVMVATSSLLFFLLSKLAKGLVDYVEVVANMLTQTTSARQSGKLQKNNTMVGEIIGDMSKAVSPVTNAVKGAGKSIKRKALGQKIDHKSIGLDKTKSETAKNAKIDYSKIKKDDSGGNNGAAGSSGSGSAEPNPSGASGGAVNSGPEGKKSMGWQGVKPRGQGAAGQTNANADGAVKANKNAHEPRSALNAAGEAPKAKQNFDFGDDGLGVSNMPKDSQGANKAGGIGGVANQPKSKANADAKKVAAPEAQLKKAPKKAPKIERRDSDKLKGDNK